MATRLAAQSVVLLLVMLLALEGIVYVITQHALLQSLEATLRDSAHPPAAMVHGNFDGDHDPHNFPQFREPGASDASTVLMDRSFKILGGAGPRGGILVDPAAARRALRSGAEQCCGIHRYKGHDYVVYSDVLREGNTIVGVSQSSISAQQYESTLDTLRRTLALVALLGIAISGIISAAMVRRALRPIRTAAQRQRDFVADAAHELRTPLAIMRAVGELGMGDTRSGERQATIEQMLAENKHLTRLVDDLSLLARADSHAIDINRGEVELSALVRDTTAELMPLAEDQGVRLETTARAPTPIVGDVLRLRQLLLILLDNAMKHTPTGGAIAVQLASVSGKARLTVSDSGPGIAAADLPHVFDRFYRADRARGGEGSGLGLAIGQWIARAHGGNIEASNAATGGAVFAVTLPLS
ncbi:MAG: sensor histidine kinase [Chloroflexota bacterium]